MADWDWFAEHDDDCDPPTTPVLCPIVTADPTFPTWQHFCIHPPNHLGIHECLDGYAWSTP